MCPLVSGITTRDAALSVELGMQAVNLALGEAALGVGDVIHGKDKDSVDDSTSASDCDGVLRQGGHFGLKLLEINYILIYSIDFTIFLIIKLLKFKI
uniref:Uncharacterized protein n=1 Tax=Cucumis sativus TaxID=3659 RepID=A0A0A0L7W4_CUCSA